MRLPVAPFEGRQPIGHVDRKTLAVRVFLLAQEEIQLIHALNWAILGDFRSPHSRQGRETIHNVDDLVTDATGLALLTGRTALAPDVIGIDCCEHNS